MSDPDSDLLARITNAYIEAKDGTLDNAALYKAVADTEALSERVPVGATKQMHNLESRKIRWCQQTCKRLGLLTRVSRGVWTLSHQLKQDLHRANASVKLIAFSTDLGIAIWGDNRAVFGGGFNEPIHLAISSPPFPLANQRAYGNVTEATYHDFICRSIEPIVKSLVPGGSVILNVTNDIHLTGSPARSMYVERTLLALHDRLGLSLVDRLVWRNPSKIPGPTQWACSVQGGRKQLLSEYEPIYWLTNDPSMLRSDNRRVLEPHTERHLSLIAAGGEKRSTSYGDGAFQLRPGSFSNETEGRIPRNVITRSHSCPDTRAYRKHAIAEGLPVHGAMMPTSIPDFFIRLLTEPEDLVVDPFAGTNRVGLAAERLGRRWIAADINYEYLYGAANAFKNSLGFSINSRIPTL